MAQQCCRSVESFSWPSPSPSDFFSVSFLARGICHTLSSYWTHVRRCRLRPDRGLGREASLQPARDQPPLCRAGGASRQARSPPDRLVLGGSQCHRLALLHPRHFPPDRLPAPHPGLFEPLPDQGRAGESGDRTRSGGLVGGVGQDRALGDRGALPLPRLFLGKALPDARAAEPPGLRGVLRPNSPTAIW